MSSSSGGSSSGSDSGIESCGITLPPPECLSDEYDQEEQEEEEEFDDVEVAARPDVCAAKAAGAGNSAYPRNLLQESALIWSLLLPFLPPQRLPMHASTCRAAAAAARSDAVW